MNQSPFNVGTRLALGDFTSEEVAELNRRYGSPLKSPTELERYFGLVGGHPYLVQRGLYQMAFHRSTLCDLEAQADGEEGPFGDELRRVFVSLTHNLSLTEAMRSVLQNKTCPTPESFYRLRSAGLVSGDSAHEVRARCPLYATYLKKHLL